MLEHAALARSAPDSARFGLEVWRATRLDDPESLLPDLLRSGADVAIYRLPVGSSQPVRRLAHLGFEVIDAGVLVYYTMDLARHEPGPLRNADVEISPTTAADDEAFAALVDASFDGYVSHYLANPLFAPPLVLAGYREWAMRHRHGGRTASWVARRDGRVVAFACCEADESSGISNGGIYGVLPSEAGSGLFGDLIRYTQRHYRDRGFKEMRMSTKVDNFAVQKVWAREGYSLYAAYDTLHVNALLSDARGGVATRTLAAGDFNRNGPLLQPAFTALIGELAGKAVRMCNVSQLPLADIDHSREHLLSVRAGWPSGGGFHRAVAMLHDDTGRPCLLAYASYRIGD